MMLSIFVHLSQGYKYIESNNDDCCGKCVQTHCIININGTTHILQVKYKKAGTD